MSIELARVGFRALLHTGDVLVEVEGIILVSPRTRFSDVLSAPDPMQSVLEASVTRHLPKGIQQEVAPEISVNRDRILLATVEEEERTGEPGLRIPLDAYNIKLLCPGFEVGGTLRTPLGGSPYNLVTTGGGRFVGLTDATVTSHAGKRMASFGGVLPFCLVNRSAIQVVIGRGAAEGAAAGDGGASSAPA